MSESPVLHVFISLFIILLLFYYYWRYGHGKIYNLSGNVKQVKHHKVPRLFVGTKKWQNVRRQNGSGSVEICRENASAVNMNLMEV